MENNKKFKTIFITLCLIVAILFFIVAIAMIFFDNKTVYGTLFLITSIIFAVASLLTKQNKINPDFSNPIVSSSIYLGFVFSIISLNNLISLNMRIGIWFFGITFFIWSLFPKRI
ncbi:MAG: hypothetical protein A2X02_00140 [Bacteroidetes bacterium GWF2_29_10]|nr:MAG: hypothetical protein A2X02_00140 [Bacteroidetes bacterium GWF2_29_10]